MSRSPGPLLAVLMLAGLLLQPQSAEAAFVPGELTQGLEPVQNLHGKWQAEGMGLIRSPFIDFELKEMHLVRTLDVTGLGGLPDTLFLYFEGLAWHSEIYLNGSLLVADDDPFSEKLIPLEKSLFKPKGNVLELRLHRSGREQAFYPRHFIAFYRQAFLLAPAAVYRPVPRVRYVDQAPKVMVVSLWDPERGPLADTATAELLVDGLFAFPSGHAVHFPFRPSSQVMALVARRGMPVLRDLNGADSIAFYNAYPLGPVPESHSLRFWRDENLKPTSYFGKFQGPDELASPSMAEPDKLALLLLILMPLLCLGAFRLLVFKMYALLPEFLTKTNIFLELIATNKFLKDEWRWLLTALRVLILASGLSLFLYYLQLNSSWSSLNFISDQSVAYTFFSQRTLGPYQIFAVVLGTLLALNLLKYMFLGLMGGIYRIFGMGAQLQNLDIFASFPLNFLPAIPAAVIFFLEGPASGLVMKAWGILFLLYFLRRIILIYGGLAKLWQFSASLIFLYICALEILPWLFLL